MITSWSADKGRTTMTTPFSERPDKLIIAITEAIIAAQGGWKRSDGEGPVTAMVDTTDTLEALAKVAT